MLSGFLALPSSSEYIANEFFTCGMNIAVFASGRGSNFLAILNAIESGTLPARVALLLSNNANAGAMETAREHNIPAVHISEKHYQSADDFSTAMLNVMRKNNVEVIALAGYLKKIPFAVVRQYRNRIFNVHPALLPKFGGPGMYGHHVHEAVLAAGETISGATVHLVDEEYDRGPIVLQKSVAVTPTDTLETLAEKVLKVEHEIYPLALAALAENRLQIEGSNVWLKSTP
jgi:phosphoribosylglycinamide formyltransferase-1